jgi:hypothetical protein
MEGIFSRIERGQGKLLTLLFSLLYPDSAENRDFPLQCVHQL